MEFFSREDLKIIYIYKDRITLIELVTHNEVILNLSYNFVQDKKSYIYINNLIYFNFMNIRKKKLIFVTQNLNKVEDAKKLLTQYSIKHINFEVPEIQSLNPREIIKHKLKFAYNKIKLPCFVMDTSLFINCLNGFPGPFIKWYFKDTVGAEKTCAIANLFNEYRCTWSTLLGYYNGEKTFFIEEKIEGIIPKEPKGDNGYDWDVIFIPKGQLRTLAEMTFEEKQKYAVTKKLLNKFQNII